MNIHEYQAKALLKEYGVGVLAGQVAYTPEEAEAAARALGGAIGRPFMVLSFLALSVIPSLKLTDRGLVDVEAWEIVQVHAYGGRSAQDAPQSASGRL